MSTPRTAAEIRQAFLDFFRERDHKIVPSAPVVNKDDPTLMFTNAGMNQFKDFFLGNAMPDRPRLADTQKCMRVSGKHNDLEDVGRDGTHHTLFEMLGNWSIGDYFKAEAIQWSWELLTDRLGIDPNLLYATVFEGDPASGVPRDEEAKGYWLRYLPEDRILYGNKKDNFWEMGDTGPCGPCTEIHVDLRPAADRSATPGRDLVNVDDSGVVEIWNNVFIQFNRRADGSLEDLPAKHVDTGMGFERLCMVLQGKSATYDTDVFTPIIGEIERLSGHTYGASYAPDAKSDMAMRVVADHLRAVAFTIADGQLPSNNGAGYVVRRILRRAVRYAYSFLGQSEPFLHRLMDVLVREMGDAFPELREQRQQITRVIEGEERSFLQTLESGLKRFDKLDLTDGAIDPQDAFELYDTYGFPFDLTRLMASERGLRVDEDGFNALLAEQKARGRADAQKQVGDWTELRSADSEFVGYDHLSVDAAHVVKYRVVQDKKGKQHQIVLDRTPFYAESGGQRGDRGTLYFDSVGVRVLDTLKENDLTVHVVDRFPVEMDGPVRAQVDTTRRRATSANHSAVHLMHAALHRILGDHAIQKGQDVDDQRLRFDFSHFGSMTPEEIARVEQLVNERIRANIPLDERRDVPIAVARESGAMMLFGEKYGDAVRIITFDEDFSSELCGGTHVSATGQIGQFKILSESGVASGVRRIEAITAERAAAYVDTELAELNAARALFKSKLPLDQNVQNLQDENRDLRKKLDALVAKQAGNLKGDLRQQVKTVDGVNVLAARVPLGDSNAIKTLAFQLEKELGNAFILLGAEVKGKPQLLLNISKNIVESHGLNAGQIIRDLAKDIRGGGGGQPFFATAGGSDLSGLDAAVARGATLVAHS